MRSMTRVLVAAGAAFGVALALGVEAQQAPDDGPRYTNGNSLVRPSDYREWMFLGAGLGMTYQPPAGAAAAGSPPPPQFTNVFVNPSSYRSFMRTGAWPDRTIFVLEIRHSGSEASINDAGRFQTGLAALEAEVKDSRFPDGWGYFNFGSAGSLADAAAPLAGQSVAACVECHTKHAAVERTFVQFYPTLLEVARQKGTVKPGF